MRKLLILCLIVIGSALFLYANNHWIVTTEHVYKSNEVPESFDGFRIAHVSDLHDATFGDLQEKLIEKVQATNPDVIFITGDVVDSNRYDLQRSLDAVRQFVVIADVYYVIGNHEVALNEVDEIYEAMRSIGVHVLENESVLLERDDEFITVAGIEDPLNGLNTDNMIDVAMHDVPDYFTLLLAHRPEYFDTYVENELDFVFSGHAHGGQARIPGIGGLIAPGQGMFPQYTAGTYSENSTTMVVSRGLGNSVVPFRIFNLPEIVVVQLKTGELK